MTVRTSSLLQDVSAYGIGNLIARAAGFVTFPIYTRLFSPQEYGLLALVWTTTGFLGPFLAIGSDTVYARFYFQAESDREKRTLTTTWFGFLLFWSSTVVVIAMVFRTPISELIFGSGRHSTLLLIGLISAPVSLLQAMLLQILRNQFRSKLYVALSVGTSLFGTTLGLVAVLVLGAGILGVVAGTLLGILMALPLHFFFTQSSFAADFAPHLLRPLLAFGLPLVPSGMAFWVFQSSDRYMLRGLATLDEIGLYAVAVTAASPLMAVAAGLGQAWLPHAVSSYEDEGNDAKELVSQVYARTVTLSAIGAILLALLAREALMVLAGDPFLAAASAVGPLAIGGAATLTIKIASTGIFIKKKSQYDAIYTWVAAGVNVALNILLIPVMGMVGAAWATAGAYLTLCILLTWASQRLWPVALSSWRLAVVTLTAIGVVAATPLLPELPFWHSLGLKAAVGLVVSMAVLAIGAPGLPSRIARMFLVKFALKAT